MVYIFNPPRPALSSVGRHRPDRDVPRPAAADRIAGDILNNWDVVRGEWVPLLPFAMKIGSELYHPAHGGDERPRSGSYTRAVNGCFDPKCCEKKE